MSEKKYQEGFEPIDHTKKEVQPVDDDEEDDEYDLRIKRTGCFEAHEKLQACYFENKDWRKCKEPMAEFKECFARYQLNKKD